jgi:putative endonuclease
MSLSVYILLCSDNSYYVGVTNDVDVRVYKHNLGLDPGAYTFSRRPVSLLWANSFQRKLEAIEWEKRIKGWSRAKKEALIQGKFDLLPELSECKNDSHFRNHKK